MEIYKLQKPIYFNGEEVIELNIDFDSLSAKDLENAERTAKKLLPKREVMVVPETNKKYLACVAAKAAGVSKELIFSLGAKDYTKVTLLVSDFLLGEESDSEEIEEENQARESNMNPKNLESKLKEALKLNGQIMQELKENGLIPKELEPLAKLTEKLINQTSNQKISLIPQDTNLSESEDMNLSEPEEMNTETMMTNMAQSENYQTASAESLMGLTT